MDDLGEALTDWLWSRLSIEGDAAREEAHALLAGPLAPLLRERDELRAKVAAVEEFARELDHHGGWDLWYASAIRAALTPATHTDGSAR